MEYSTLQMRFLLALIANVGNGKWGFNLSKKIYDLTKSSLTHIPDWTLVWGSAVDRKFIWPAKNIMYIAYSPAANTYGIGIAGTNPNSIYDWLVEDLEVKNLLAWPWPETNPPSGAKISKGTMAGLKILQSMVPLKRMPGRGQTIAEFLKADLGKRAKGVKVVTCGHSLGGALAPTLALWLKDTLSDWDTDGKVGAVETFGFAGPTAGNQAFAEYSNRQLPATHRILNAKDIVPHSWDIADLEMIPTIYQLPDGKGIESKVVDAGIRKVLEITKGNGYTQIGKSPHILPGSVNTSIIDPDRPGEFINFGTQVAYQHINAYFALLDLPEDVIPEAVHVIPKFKTYS